MKPYILPFIYLLFCLLLNSCKKQEDPKPVSIDPVFQKYVDTFLSEASKRGKDIDLTKVGMTLQFGDTKLLGRLNGQINDGIAFYETQSININKDGWPGWSDDYKEFVLYHEMGHLLLKRDHFSKLWTNGEAQSMMHSLEDNNVQSSPIFEGFRKKYYLDELFNPNIQTEPNWCKSQAIDKPLTTHVGLPKHEENFDNKISLPAVFNNITTLKFSFVAGAMLIANTDTIFYSIGIKNFIPALSATTIKNYEIRCRFRNKGTDRTSILWNQNESMSNLYSFTSFPNNTAYIGSNTGSFQNLLVKSSFSEWNKIVLRYESANVDVWLNGKLLFTSDIVSPMSNDNWRYAFGLRPNSVIEIDYLKIYSL